jgi:putative protein kinase ArgK-like GTPase of G3E family
MIILGITGTNGAGKGTVADYLRKDIGMRKLGIGGVSDIAGKIIGNCLVFGNRI